LFGVLPEPIEDLSFAIIIEGGMLLAVSGLVQPVREARLDMGRFCEILHPCDALAWDFELLKICAWLSEFVNSVWDIKLCDA
jgi:hypothetical protein